MILKITQDQMRQRVADELPNKSNIVEIGCSNGNFASLIKGENSYIGVDILSEKINEARKKLPYMNFINCDIMKNLYILKQVSLVVSFQCLEHIQDDIKLIKAIPPGMNVIFSVPNRQYPGHVRWFELNGWKKRFAPYIILDDVITIQHPVKPNNRTFLLRGIRNDA